MMRIYFISILIFGLNIFSRSSEKSFYTKDNLKEKIIYHFEKKFGKKETEKLYDDINNFYDDLPSEESKNNFITLLNEFYNLRLYSYKNYRNFANLLNKLEDHIDDSKDIEIWLYNYLNLIKNTPPSNSQWAFNLNISLLLDNKILSKTNTIYWGIDPDSKIKFVNDSKGFKYHIETKKLYCKYGTNYSLNINNVRGIYNLVDFQFYLEEGRVDWSRLKKNPEALYVNIKNTTIDLHETFYTTNDAFLNYNQLEKYDLKGSLKHVVYGKSDDNNKLVFTSYSTIKYEHPSGSYSCEGIFKTDGKRDNLIADSTLNKASLRINRNKKELFFIEGNELTISDNIVTSPRVSFTINLNDTSKIYSSSEKLMLNYSKKVLFFENTSLYGVKKSLGPISNGYSKLSMNVSKTYFAMDSSYIYFTCAGNKDIIMTSDSYYDSPIHKKFRGLNEKNPLQKLDSIIKANDNRTKYTFDEISKYMNSDKNSLYSILVELSELGYVDADMEGNKILFLPRFLELEDLKRGNIDYDNMYISKNNEKDAVLKLNLDTYELETIHVNEISISSSDNISLYPYNGRSIIKKNRSIDIKEGALSVGGYDMWGKDIYFDYDDYYFRLKGILTGSITIPSFKANESGLFDSKTLLNRIDGISGYIYLNNPNNKSNKKDSLQYPKLETNGETYVFYDNPKILEGNYSRGRFYFKIPPFKKDSLIINSTFDKLFFEGTMHTEVFPDFDEKIKPQKDFSLGFIRKTPKEGYPVYQKRGNFKNIISLSSKGLKGIGTLSYSASTSESENVTFYLDSLVSSTKKLNIKETKNEIIDVPDVSHDFVDLKWDVLSDTMYMKSKTQFSIYGGVVKSNSILKLTSHNLTGKGMASIRNSKIDAISPFVFKSKNFSSDNMNFSLRENDKSPYEFFINEAYGNIDIENQKADFKLNKENAFIDIEPIEFRALVKNAYWNMNEASVLMKEENDSLSWIISTGEKNEGLKFKAGEAIYSLRTKTLISENVEVINVADAVIYPDNKKLVVEKGGKMQKLKNALVNIIDESEKTMHQFKEAEISILNGKSYIGSGKYIYTDMNKVEHLINFSSIGADSLSKAKSKGNTYVDKKNSLNISPKFSFYGNIFLLEGMKNMNFRGYVDLKNQCKENISIGKKISVNSFVNPDSLVLNIGSPEQGINPENIYCGILYPEEHKFEPVFMHNDNDKSKEYVFIKNNVENVKYDHDKKCFITSNTENYNSYFYDEDCLLKLDGEINFYNMGKSLEMEGFAELEQNLKTKEVSFNDFTYSVNFDIGDNDIMEKITEEFNFKYDVTFDDTIIKIKTADYSDSKVEYDTIIEKISKKSVVSSDIITHNKTYQFFQDRYIPEHKNTNKKIGFGREDDLDKRIKRDFLVNNMELVWNIETKCFYSKKNNLEILQIGKMLIGKVLKGKFEIQKDRISDIVTIYFEHPDKKHYYFFRFSKNRVNFLTDNNEIMSMYRDMVDKGGNVKYINGEEYELRIPSEIMIKAFLLKYY